MGIATWFAENLAAIGDPALVIYENGRVPGLAELAHAMRVLGISSD